MSEYLLVEIDDSLLPDGVSGACFDPVVLRGAAEAHCRHPFDHEMHVKAWVVLHLLNAYEASSPPGTQDTVCGPELTKEQARAMHVFLYTHGEGGYEREASDSAVWDWNVRPWPTMRNLEAKGLVKKDSWIGPDEGFLWALTEAGCEYMAALVASRTPVPAVLSGPEGATT